MMNQVGEAQTPGLVLTLGGLTSVAGPIQSDAVMFLLGTIFGNPGQIVNRH